MEYVLLFIYRFFISIGQLLSVDLVVMLLLFSCIFYGACLALLMVFGIENFVTENDNCIQNRLAENTVRKRESTEDLDKNSHSISAVTMCILNLLLCHITIFTSFCTILFVTLYECIQNSMSPQCVLTWGNHVASKAIAVTIVLTMLSIIIPLLNLYKMNSLHTHIFEKYVGTYLIFYVFFTHVILESKLNDYRSKCFSTLYITANIRWFYVGVCVHLIYQFIIVLVVNIYAPQSTVAVYSTHLAKQYENWTVSVNTLNMLCTSAILLFYIAYGYNMSGIFNIVQSILLGMYVISSSYKIIFQKHTLTVKKHVS